MLIKLKLENWMSFRDSVIFTMIPSEDSLHRNRLPIIKPYDIDVLPIAAILGGNASGKSNFVSALDFARKFILNGANEGDLIPVRSFILDEKFESKPTSFRFELLMEETIYVFEFSATHEIVVSESLSEIQNSKKVVIYEIRREKLEIMPKYEHEEFFRILFENRKNNQLFLTTVCTLTGIKLPVYNWFKDCLNVFVPEDITNLHNFCSNQKLLDSVNELLKTLDCGVFSLDLVDNSKEASIGGKMDAKKVISYHKDGQGNLRNFGIEKESSGTIRLINLLSVFIMLSQANGNKVFVIDEIDRSLHTKTFLSMIEAFLDNCARDMRTQLIFVANDTHIMDNNYLRNDEMWITDRDKSGNSRIYSVGEYEGIHPEMNVQENYLIGRFKGVPDMLLTGNQLSKPVNENSKLKNSPNCVPSTAPKGGTSANPTSDKQYVHPSLRVGWLEKGGR